MGDQRTIVEIQKFQGGYLKKHTVTAIYRFLYELAFRGWCWRTNGKLSIAFEVGMAALLLWGCLAADANSSARSKTTIGSVYTDITSQSCRKEVDKDDPNETPYLVCPGVEGYALVIRRVDAGRRSIDLVDSSAHVHPLSYQDVVTRHMFALSPKVEWRVAKSDQKRVPIALIVRVQAREDNDNPDRVTHTYIAIAKITPNEVCVTDTILAGTRSETIVRSTADSARERPCVPQLSPMTTDGVIIR